MLVKYVDEEKNEMYVGENTNIQFHTYSPTYYFMNKHFPPTFEQPTEVDPA